MSDYSLHALCESIESALSARMESHKRPYPVPLHELREVARGTAGRLVRAFENPASFFAVNPDMLEGKAHVRGSGIREPCLLLRRQPRHAGRQGARAGFGWHRARYHPRDGLRRPLRGFDDGRECRALWPVRGGRPHDRRPYHARHQGDVRQRQSEPDFRRVLGIRGGTGVADVRQRHRRARGRHPDAPDQANAPGQARLLEAARDFVAAATANPDFINRILAEHETKAYFGVNEPSRRL